MVNNLRFLNLGNNFIIKFKPFPLLFTQSNIVSTVNSSLMQYNTIQLINNINIFIIYIIPLLLPKIINLTMNTRLSINSHILHNTFQIYFQIVQNQLRILHLFPLFIIPESFNLSNQILPSLVHLQRLKSLLLHFAFIAEPHIVFRKDFRCLELLKRF